jgi:hypothetical protein
MSPSTIKNFLKGEVVGKHKCNREDWATLTDYHEISTMWGGGGGYYHRGPFAIEGVGDDGFNKADPFNLIVKMARRKTTAFQQVVEAFERIKV